MMPHAILHERRARSACAPRTARRAMLPRPPPWCFRYTRQRDAPHAAVAMPRSRHAFDAPCRLRMIRRCATRPRVQYACAALSRVTPARALRRCLPPRWCCYYAFTPWCEWLLPLLFTRDDTPPCQRLLRDRQPLRCHDVTPHAERRAAYARTICPMPRAADAVLCHAAWFYAAIYFISMPLWLCRCHLITDYFRRCWYLLFDAFWLPRFRRISAILFFHAAATDTDIFAAIFDYASLFSLPSFWFLFISSPPPLRESCDFRICALAPCLPEDAFRHVARHSYASAMRWWVYAWRRMERYTLYISHILVDSCYAHASFMPLPLLIFSLMPPLLLRHLFAVIFSSLISYALFIFSPLPYFHYAFDIAEMLISPPFSSSLFYFALAFAYCLMLRHWCCWYFGVPLRHALPPPLISFRHDMICFDIDIFFATWCHFIFDAFDFIYDWYFRHEWYASFIFIWFASYAMLTLCALLTLLYFRFLYFRHYFRHCTARAITPLRHFIDIAMATPCCHGFFSLMVYFRCYMPLLMSFRFFFDAADYFIIAAIDYFSFASSSDYLPASSSFLRHIFFAFSSLSLLLLFRLFSFFIFSLLFFFRLYVYFRLHLFDWYFLPPLIFFIFWYSLLLLRRFDTPLLIFFGFHDISFRRHLIRRRWFSSRRSRHFSLFFAVCFHAYCDYCAILFAS